MSENHETLIPVTALGLGVGRRTIGRRIKDRNSGFPAVIRCNGRLYVRLSELGSYKAKLIAAGASMAPPKEAPKCRDERS